MKNNNLAKSQSRKVVVFKRRNYVCEANIWRFKSINSLCDFATLREKNIYGAQNLSFKIIVEPLKIFILFIIFSSFFSCGIKKSLAERPDISSYTLSKFKKEIINDSLFVKGKSSFRKNKFQQWELVAFGENPLDLGNTVGSLTQDLIKSQELIFLEKIEKIVPSKSKRNLLIKILALYNRKIQTYITTEYKTEILGLSKYASNKYDHLAPKYLRSLILHGAHDIGHAFQDLALVGCTSFAVWGNKTEDGDLLIARNFDFYAGDAFSKEKIISFIQPEKGYKFMSVSWAGMIGVMSGMNEKGLTVTINAGKSNIPLLAKTPISLVTREILQYASTINEAIEIAKKKEVFVSESIMVGSAIDNNAVLIEISPKKFGVYQVENSSQMVCSNHFQSETYKKDKNNNKQIKESHSVYRFKRMTELLAENDKITPKKAVSILRNTKGLKDKEIGFGNEKALNQLLAHHGIVFQPKKKTVWVSSNPYQLGEFVAFQLDSVFSKQTIKKSSLSLSNKNIAKDSFANSIVFYNYEKYRILERQFEQKLENNKDITPKEIVVFKKLNPNYWKTNYLIGKYYYKKKYYTAALQEFNNANSKEVTTLLDKNNINKYIKELHRKLE